MTIRAHITDLPFPGEVRIWLVHETEGRVERNYRPGSFGGTWEPIDADARTSTEVPPMLQLPAEYARALADALVRHFHGTEDTRALRRDYDAERQRVDAQAQVIADVARTLAATRIGGAQ